MSFPGYRWLSRLEELDPGLEKDLDVSVEVFLHTRGWPHQRHGGQLPPDLSGDADGEHAFIAFIFGIEVFLVACLQDLRACQETYPQIYHPTDYSAGPSVGARLCDSKSNGKDGR